MKKLLLLSAIAAAFSASAQTPKWVSTSPQNKKVVLEEFTGIHCGYCPDGHRIANTLVASNPGNVFLINIHAGSFATPSTGEPDFRTTAGTAIDAAAGVTGYPSGSINRMATPWGASRSLWTSQASAVLAQASPVNVAVRANIDMVTRVLTTEVEVYYTGNGTGTSNKLTIALVEDNILGPQSDYGNYNPTNWVNGKYRHNHVLRQLITGGDAFGESLDTVTSGKYYNRVYKTTIPASYNNVPVVLPNLKVVAFVAETNAKILSADEAAADFDAALKTDLQVENSTAALTMCANSVTPKVDVTNLGDNTVTGFKVTATINGTPYTQTVTAPLAKNAKTTVTFPVVNISNGGNLSMAMGAISDITSSTGALYDINSDNDNAFFNGMSFISAAIPTNNVWAGFETVKHTGFDGSQNPNYSVPTNTTAYGHWSAKALRFALHSSWGVAGKPAVVYMGKINLASVTNPGLAYWYAYSDDNLGGSAPTVKVEVSKDCGANWSVVNTTTAVQTGLPAVSGNWYVPVSNDYKMVGMSLDAFKTDEVIVRISVTPGTTGNAFYLDEVSISSASSMGVKENVAANGFEMFPNPTNGNFTLKVDAFDNASFRVVDMTGKQVLAGNINSNETTVNSSNLNNGVYLVEVSVNGKTAVQKLNVAH